VNSKIINKNEALQDHREPSSTAVYKPDPK